MAFDKLIPAKIAEYKIFDVNSRDELVKEASDVDFPEGFVFDPDFLYLWIRIVSAGEFYGSNNNADYFPESELVEYFETFNEAHPFKNHENKNVENAIGKIFTVRWNPVMKCVELLKGIDKKRSPEIARGYLKGYLTDVSMGCKVPYTVCSICGNKARKRSEFCDHVKYYRNQLLSTGERVYEINYKPKFHDSSTVLRGAERVAKAFFIIDSPPKDDTIITSFRKAASNGKSTRYIPISQHETEKLASYQETIHPLLKEASNKIEYDSPMMRKIAELEKELTGKLLNIVSSPDKEELPKMNQMLEVIKFLTEKRMDDDSLINIAESVKEVASENNVPISRAFSTLIGVAELMGIEFFPNELHTLLTHLTDAKLNEKINFNGSRIKGTVFPSDYVTKMNRALEMFNTPSSYSDPASLLNIYNDAAHRTRDFLESPREFISSIPDSDGMNFHPPVRMIRIIRKTLEPLSTVRSYHPEHLYPRLSVVLNGHKPIIGGPEVHNDLGMLSSPACVGDLLGGLAFSLYEKMRPSIKMTPLFKVANEATYGFTKTASIPAWKLALVGVPAAYGASAFQKSRRDNGRYLSDAENFVADNPHMVAGAALLGSKPASMVTRGISNTAGKAKDGVKKAKDKITEPFRKESSESIESLVKTAEPYPTGDFNVFGDYEVLKTYASETGASPEEASAVKMATLLSLGGMKKEAYQIQDFYNIPNQEKERFLKIAANHMEQELEKVSEDFTNNMLLSMVGDPTPLNRSLPGRAVDAFIFKKLGQIGEDDDKKKLKTKPDIETPSSANTWNEHYRQGPALPTQSKGEIG